MENIITLYHGSNKIIRTPQYGAGKQKVDATKMARDSRARQEYFSSRKDPRKRGDIYMLQILDEEMKADDPRIR